MKRPLGVGQSRNPVADDGVHERDVQGDLRVVRRHPQHLLRRFHRAAPLSQMSEGLGAGRQELDLRAAGIGSHPVDDLTVESGGRFLLAEQQAGVGEVQGNEGIARRELDGPPELLFSPSVLMEQQVGEP